MLGTPFELGALAEVCSWPMPCAQVKGLGATLLTLKASTAPTAAPLP